jgi:aspartyl-tRNA(Asn)/glutamyl-tRNA(Gln) amidotransferase subunit A
MQLTIALASAAQRQGTLTSLALVEHAIEAYGRDGQATNAFITFTPAQALDDARACDADARRGHWRGPLHGIPISIKDLIDVAGTPTTAGSRVMPSTDAARDAEVVARLRAAGAIVLGKTNLHEFAFGTTSEDSAFGAVRNPLDPARMAGGSSGGSAAAVAAGIGLGSVGTDTGGSIRIPAALCGLVGLKPSYGEVPVDGVVPLAPSFDHVGPIAWTVEDAWALWRVMTGSTEDGGSSRGVKGLRLGVPSEYFFDLLEDTVRAAWDGAVETLSQRGARIHPASIPHAGATPEAYLPIVFRESWAWHQPFIERSPDLYTPAVRSRLELGRAVGQEEYARAVSMRAMLAAEVDAALEEVDALVLPAMAVTAPLLGTTEIRFAESVQPVRAVMLRLTQLFDITGHPAITVPMQSGGPLPCGFQLVGPRSRTAALLAIAKAVEDVVR